MPYTPSSLPANWTWDLGLDAVCPGADALLNSPFRPYFVWPYLAADASNCYGYAECHFERAPESRKQQWAALVLVMGVLPITLFANVRWPRKNFVCVRRRLDWGAEVVVRALGLDVLECGGDGEAGERNAQTWLGRWMAGRRREGWWAWAPWAASLALLLGMYAVLALTEVYSKRSSIGCVYPVFVLTWYLIAIVPATIHTVIRRHRQRDSSTSGGPKQHVHGAGMTEEAHEDLRDWWPIQLAWNIYYIAGTLVYSSIMVVMVPELVVWVFASCATVIASKVCAFLLCELLDGGHDPAPGEGGVWIPLQSQ